MSVTWFKSRFSSISSKLFLCFFLIWFPFSCIVAGGLLVTSIRLTENTINGTEDKIAYFSAIINADLNRVKDLLYTMCADDEVTQFALQRDQSFEYKDYLAYVSAYTRLKEYQQTSMYIDDIFLVLPNTQELLSVNHSIDSIDNDIQNMINEYQKSGVSFFIQGDSLVYLFESSNNIMMGINVSVKHIQNTLQSYERDATYDFFLIDSISGQLLGEDTVGKLGLDVYNVISDSKTIPEEIQIKNVKYIMGQIRTQSNHFDIIIYTDKKILYKDVFFVKNLWIFLNIVAISVPFLMVVIISKTLQKPMNKLVKAMQKVEEEVYDFRLPLDESSEFRYVFHQYNCMAAKVEKLIQEVYEKQLQVQQSKLKQLQAQINPHFLFNSFYMGYRMAKSGESEKVAQLCVYLGDYFKSLTYISDDYIALGEDIKFVNTYLLLNQMRFPDKLLYEIKVDNGLEEVLIPHLFIQPLIENAIRHGAERIRSSCTIILQIKDFGEMVHISVEDDCNIITEEKIEELGELLKQEECPQQNVGLWNIQQRLKTIQETPEGKPGGLHIERFETGVFRVSFSMLKRRN